MCVRFIGRKNSVGFRVMGWGRGWIYIRDMNMRLNYSPSPVATIFRGHTPRSAIRYCPRNTTHSALALRPMSSCNIPGLFPLLSIGPELSLYLGQLSRHRAHFKGWMTADCGSIPDRGSRNALRLKRPEREATPSLPHVFLACISTTLFTILIYWTQTERSEAGPTMRCSLPDTGKVSFPLENVQTRHGSRPSSYSVVTYDSIPATKRPGTRRTTPT
jgi:hypothetical protein